MSRRTTGLLVAAVVGLTGCGETPADDPTLTQPSASAAAPVQGPVAPAPQACSGGPVLSPAPQGSTKNLTVQPVVPKGPATVSELVAADVVVGSGAAACTGLKISVKYVGVLADGTPFDASWDRGADETFELTLGAGDVIKGWDQGLIGMKVGGRRQLTIPGDLGYGPEGRNPIPPNATLVFVVDLVKVG